jgi:hypothetical protein
LGVGLTALKNFYWLQPNVRRAIVKEAKIHHGL